MSGEAVARALGRRFQEIRRAELVRLQKKLSKFGPVERADVDAVTAPAPLWLGGWLSRWVCLAATLDDPVAGRPERCETCELWEPRAGAQAEVDVAEERGA